MSEDEQADVLDAYGDKTGQVLSKHDIHRRELWHAGAHVWIYNRRGEVLLQKRAPHKEVFPDIWDTAAAGHLLHGDSFVDAALRETQEELGLDLHKTDLEFVGVVRSIQEIPGAGFTHHVFDAVFIVCQDLDVTKLHLQEEEVAEVRWWPMWELEAALQGPDRSVLFPPRADYPYGMALTEIRAALARKKEREG